MKKWKRWEAAFLLALTLNLTLNWWCTVYPSLCEDMPQTVVTQGVADSESQQIELRFRTVELWQKLCRFLQK